LKKILVAKWTKNVPANRLASKQAKEENAKILVQHFNLVSKMLNAKFMTAYH